jgi:hypothetical protein
VIIGPYLGAVTVLEPTHRWRSMWTRSTTRPLAAAVCARLLVLIGAQRAWSIPNGLIEGQKYRASREIAASLSLQYWAAPHLCWAGPCLNREART